VKYADGQEVLLGDAVDLGGGSVGRVVAVLDTGRYSQCYLAEEWSYLKEGVLLEAHAFGLVHCTESGHDFTLLGRGEAS